MRCHQWLDLFRVQLFFSISFPTLAMPHLPGEVWFLPPETKEGGDSKGRRHVLLTPCREESDLGTFAYASTRATEARCGAAFLFVDPTIKRRIPTGFTRPSYVYASRLVPAESEALLRRTGRLLDEMPQLRVSLRKALGIGTGVSEGRGTDSRNWRGRVVRLSRVRTELIGYSYGIVLTERSYSKHERYQIIVPVDRIDELEPGPGDLEVTTAEWISAVIPGPSGALVALRDVQSVYHSVDIDGWTGAVVDPVTMSRIETALATLFGL